MNEREMERVWSGGELTVIAHIDDGDRRDLGVTLLLGEEELRELVPGDTDERGLSLHSAGGWWDALSNWRGMDGRKFAWWGDAGEKWG